jgi:hypothetical protein
MPGREYRMLEAKGKISVTLISIHALHSNARNVCFEHTGRLQIFFASVQHGPMSALRDSEHF